MAQDWINIPAVAAASWKQSVATSADLPALNNQIGDVRVSRDTGDLYEWNGTSWQLVGGGAGPGVSSLNTLTGALTLAAGTGISITPSGGDTLTITNTASYTFIDSLVNSSGNVSLVNDAATPGNSQYYGTNGSGTKGFFSLPSAGTGTVTSVSVVSANGLAGTVATATTTPAITLSTTVTGILYGNGTTVSAAIASNFPTLNQSTTGTAANITATSNSTLTTLSALSLPYSQVTGAPAAGITQLTGGVTAGPGSGSQVATVVTNANLTGDVTSVGNASSLVATTNSTITTLSALSLPYSQITGAPATVTSVTGTNPIVSSGGTTPAISIQQAIIGCWSQLFG